MTNNTKEYILCAAIKRITPKDCTPYHKGTNDICDIEIGYRHHDILQRFQGEVSKKIDDQGFYTSNGRFVDRRMGMYIAWLAGQVSSEISGVERLEFSDLPITKDNIHIFNNLYSEDLY